MTLVVNETRTFEGVSLDFNRALAAILQAAKRIKDQYLLAAIIIMALAGIICIAIQSTLPLFAAIILFALAAFTSLNASLLNTRRQGKLVERTARKEISEASQDAVPASDSDRVRERQANSSAEPGD